MLKNYLYSKNSVKPLYDEYWHSVFEDDEDDVEFWNDERTSGRVKRNTIELFLYSFLVILKEGSVKMDSLFKEFKSYLSDKSDIELVKFAKEIKEYALIYKGLPDGRNLAVISYFEQEKRFFHLIT